MLPDVREENWRRWSEERIFSESEKNLEGKEIGGGGGIASPEIIKLL